MTSRDRGHLLGAFAAMVFVGASWGANVPISKVMLAHFDLIPLSALRAALATIVLILMVAAVEGSPMAAALRSPGGAAETDLLWVSPRQPERDHCSELRQRMQLK